MARNKDLARLPRNPKISAVLVWEKDKEGKSGRLVFSDMQYEPIIIEVDELKRMHKPQETARQDDISPCATL